MNRVGGATGLLLFGFLVFLVATGAWQVALVVVAVLAVLGGFQLLERRRTARRAAPDGLHDPVWRVRIYQGHEALMGEASWLGLLWEPYALADVAVTAEGLIVTPTRTMRWARYRERTVAWSDVVSATERPIGRETPDGKLSLTSLTLVTVQLTGDAVPWVLRPDWRDHVEAEIGGGDVTFDEQDHRDAQDWMGDVQTEMLGADGVMGALPVRMTTDHPQGLVDAIRARASGQPLS